MFLRQTRRRKDGKTHVYWNIVENRRLDDGRVVQRQVLYLGEIHSSAGEFASKFKDTFRQSIRRAIEAYPEARVEITSEGLVMRYSDPVDLRRAFVALPGDGAKLPRQRSSTQRQFRSIAGPQTPDRGKEPELAAQAAG